MLVTQEFLEYHPDKSSENGSISDHYKFSTSNAAKPAWNYVAMNIVFGKIVTEIQQYFYK